jgi:hypothetical protein
LRLCPEIGNIISFVSRIEGGRKTSSLLLYTQGSSKIISTKE